MHVDAVQAAGRLPTDLRQLGADSMAVSSHKLGGPPGAGALVIARDLTGPVLMPGGGQEKGRRGGTPPVAVIAGFAAAAAAASPDLLPWRTDIEAAAIAAGATVLGGPDRLPNTVCLALPGAAAQTQLIALDLAGVHVSAGSACSSGKVARSHVLDAMGLGALAGEAIRVSLPWNATAADVAHFAEAYLAMSRRISRKQAA
jgi:cysteine desulfurase